MRLIMLLVGVVMLATSVVLLLTGASELPLEVTTPADPEVVAPAEAGSAEEGRAEAGREQVAGEDNPSFLDRRLEVPPTREAPDAPEPDPVARPVRIQVDAIGVDHPIIPVGLHADGSMEIPHDVHELGWYEPGVKPGELGSAVIAGHVDTCDQGPGAFFDLRLLEAGDTIEVTDEDGISRVWTVDQVARYPKDQLPMEDLFRWEGDSADLVLVTCGGAFDRSLRSYEDNIVVHAAG